MIGATVWLVGDPPRRAGAGPLEVMGDRRLTKAEPEARAATLDGARPPGAPPPAPMVPFDADEPTSQSQPSRRRPKVPPRRSSRDDPTRHRRRPQGRRTGVDPDEPEAAVEPR